MVNNQVSEMLNKQVNLELFSAYLYLEIANYFVDEGLDGFGHWFNLQAHEEMDHARIILNYLQDNEIKIELKTIEDPSRDYKGHMEALEEVLSHEKLITDSIHKIYELAMNEKDFRSMQFLDWFIEEQAEEEATSNELISKYKVFTSDGKGLYALDQEMGQRIREQPAILIEE